MLNTVSKIISFFDKRDKKICFILLLSFCLIGFFEMLSVASIAPLVAVISHSDIIFSHPVLNSVYQALGFTSVADFILFLGGLVFIFLVMGNGFAAIAQWGLMRFSFLQSHKISTRMLKQYLLEPYAYYLNHNRAEMSKTILSDVYKVVTGVFVNGLQAIAKLIVIVCLFSLLIYVSPFLALFVGGMLGGAYLLFYFLLSKKLSTQGAAATLINGKQYQIVNETLGAIKEVKVLGRESDFLEKFKAISRQYVKAEAMSIISPQITRYVIESIAFGGILLIILYLVRMKGDISQVLPLLALYTLAGYRLLPPMQQTFVGLSLARFYTKSLDAIYQLLLNKNDSLDWLKEEEKPFAFTQHILLKSVSYYYPFSQVKALDTIDLSIKKNACVGLVGMTGSGKTTMVDLLLGLLDVSEGKIFIDEQILSIDNIKDWQRKIGYVPQKVFLTDDTIAHNIALGIQATDIDREAVIKAAKLANLHEFIEKELPQEYDTMIGENGNRLSGGQCQRIGIARALYHNPEILVLDEATSALDRNTEKNVMASIAALSHQKTIIIIAHRLSTVEQCDCIYFFEKGKIIDSGTYEELVARNNKFRNIAAIG